MNRFKKVISRIIASIFFLALTLNFNACSEQSPLESNNNDEYGFNILKSKNSSLSKAFQKTQEIDENGGTIVVGSYEHGRSSLYFPEGAVDDEIEVTFWWESTGFLMGGAEFSPHGTTFNVPVRISLSYKDADLTGVNLDNLKIWYYHEDTGVWEALPSYVDHTRDSVIAFTTHFSRYAIGETP